MKEERCVEKIHESLKFNLIFPPPSSHPPRSAGNQVDYISSALRSVSFPHFSTLFSKLYRVYQRYFIDTFKRQYHCPSAWYVNLLRGCLLIRFSTTSFTVHDPLSWQRRQRPTFLMHDSRRKSAEKGLVSPISGTDWVIRIYRRNTRFLPADCRRYRIRFDKLHSLFPFPFFPFLSSRKKETALPPFSRSPIVRLFDLLRDTRQRNLCCFDKQYTEISADKVEPFQRGEMMIIVFARNTGRNIIFRLLSPNRYKLHLHYLG